MSSVIREKNKLSKLTLTPLKELGQWSGGGTPSKAKAEYWASGTIPWVSPKDMKVAHISDSEDHITEDAVAGSAAKLIPAGSVLIVTRSGILSHSLPVAVSTVPVTVNQDLKALTPKNGVLPEYVAWALRGFARDILNACTKQGTTVSSIDTTALHRFEIPIAPLDQQKSIVAEIEKQFSRLDEAVANLKRVKANLKRYKAAVLKAAVEGRLVETEAELARREGRSYETGAQLLQRILETRRSQWKGKGKYKEPAAPDTTDLPELPEGWVWSFVSGLGDVVGGLTKNPKRSKLTTKLPYLRVANVYANELRLDEIEEIGVDDSELEKLLVLKGDLLIVEGNGSPDQIGRLAIWDGSIAPCVHQNHLIKVRLAVDCLPDWVVGWLMSIGGRAYIREIASSTSGLYTLSVGKVGGLPVPLPPVNEQRRIVKEVERCLSIIREAEAQIEANLKRAERLRQSILSRAFCGGLTESTAVPVRQQQRVSV